MDITVFNGIQAEYFTESAELAAGVVFVLLFEQLTRAPRLITEKVSIRIFNFLTTLHFKRLKILYCSIVEYAIPIVSV
jgi:hypothetical protein